jgi:hypothetical protein
MCRTTTGLTAYRSLRGTRGSCVVKRGGEADSRNREYAAEHCRPVDLAMSGEE